ncbi:hypothetical protein F5B19DRAFT_480936 [Rostrohypoxylon terebratum]|nr:hypothetical protein F5B19DRAFT_480936 [Rostrohypoxylon terebratum]
MSSSRKRVISSCIPCYTRKQKCNRECPCNHCSRRQCPEDCAYYPTTANRTSSPGVTDIPESKRRKGRGAENRDEWSAYIEPVLTGIVGPSAGAVAETWSDSTLAEAFGYLEDSDSNTLALIRKLGSGRDEGSSGNFVTLTPETVDEVHRHIDNMPDRPILDFLVQYFASEVNWMVQLIDVPWFLEKYQAWWTVDRVRSASEVEFATLILRVCSYALQFLPSPGYTLDKIRGVLLSDVRNMCDETANNLEAIGTAADCRGSLVRVQHLAFFGLQCQIEGKTTALWEVLSRAIRVARSLGMYNETVRSHRNAGNANRIDQEMERRIFYNLYIWDSALSRHLDRSPLIPGCLPPENRPHLHLLESKYGAGEDCIDSSVDTPDPFAERLLQVRLADFWRNVGPTNGAEYDIVAAEERYDKFCREYLSQIPSSFALVNPDEALDKRFPKLRLQRKLLHIGIYDSLCWNFRPLLLQQPLPLPTYKRVLLDSQKKALAIAALHALNAVSQLHSLLGGCHTRLAGIIFSTFEAAVLLVCLIMDPTFPRDDPDQHSPPSTATKTDPLQAATRNISRQECLQAVQGALERLQMLAEVSSMADVGAKTLVSILNKTSKPSISTNDEGLMQNQEVGSTITAATTNSQFGETSAAGEATAWFPCDPPDLHPVYDLATTSDSLQVGDMSSWPPYDLSSMFSHDVFK